MTAVEITRDNRAPICQNRFCAVKQIALRFFFSDEEESMIKLYVGGLPFDVTEDQLHQMFAAVGSVASAKLIVDRETGQSKGFGFVEMSDDAEGQAAIQKINGTKVG